MKHRIELLASPLLYPHRTLTDSHVAVAVDILRATTSICAAFQAGADEVMPLLRLDDLAYYCQQGYQSAAERNGQRVNGAQWGNSPCDYLTHNLHGIRLAFSSTNGTVAIHAATAASKVLIGAFCNLSVLVNYLHHQKDDVVIICSGWKNDLSLEDTLFGGALVDALCHDGPFEAVNDAATMAVALWRSAHDDLHNYCRNATHVQRLLRLGYSNDVDMALRMDTCPVLPFRTGDEPLRRLC